ncbi:response regulator transcription factor [Aerococcaceae bacterium NML210727]|nr:response regulator transcription factor [Aerococcaceae bacterium NML210727]MCW6654701.1 response regulator transcription factor [Aerococcaceae bacterium NML201296]MCW6660710.1 response regulator transcription factor [Aerococcaceae bacterium NML201209]MCW6675086.1 response regulator transcription factor [Aerococcaceae bacterium NML171108]MCW6676436.1 response regulator transcription factor [Aerococcaceae bacterium NML180378]MCW6682326.1 response regulator transcription factor [Aerococcaceae 
MTIRTILIDDDCLVVQALETIISSKPGLAVVATGNDGNEAVTLYATHRPDIVLMDIRMAQLSGLDAARQILEHFPQARILFITTFQDDEYIAKALALGCHGYILKQNIKGILPAIEAVMNGQLVFDSNIVSRFQSQSPPKNIAHLSQRENELLHLVAEGLNNKEIAETLFLSEGTVRNYLSQLLEKLDLRDRTQLAIYYYKQ